MLDEVLRLAKEVGNKLVVAPKQYKKYKPTAKSGYVYEMPNGELKTHVGKTMQCYKLLNRLDFERHHDLDDLKPVALVILPLEEYDNGKVENWEEVHERFYNWLFNDSPWAEVYHTKVWSKDLYNDGIVLRTDVHYALVGLACPPCRFPYERLACGTVWCKMVDIGVDPFIAFLIAHAYPHSTDKVVPCLHNHAAMDISYLVVEGIEKIRHLELDEVDLTDESEWYCNRKSYTNTGYTFQDYDLHDNFTNSLYQLLYNLDLSKVAKNVITKVNNPFAGAVEFSRKPSLDEALPVIVENVYEWLGWHWEQTKEKT